MFRRPGSRLIKDPGDLRVGDIVKSECLKECICILGYPWDWTTAGRPGARFAPSKIREHFYSMSPPDGRCVCDLGDVDVAPGDLRTSTLRLRESVKKLCGSCASIFVIGGDHSLTATSVEALVEGLGLSKVGLLVFDAHFDLRRLSEGYSSGTYLRDLLERLGDKIVPLIIGIRRHSNPPYAFDEASRLNVRFVAADEVKIGGLNKALEAIDGAFSAVKDVYISVDMDCLDQSVCLGVNSPSAGGLDVWDVIKVLKGALRNRRLIGGDVVEVVPLLDVGDSCARSAAFILYNLVYGGTTR